LSKKIDKEAKVVMAFDVNGRKVQRMDRAWVLCGQLFNQGERPVRARFVGWERID
jgi:hypothetical protein